MKTLTLFIVFFVPYSLSFAENITSPSQRMSTLDMARTFLEIKPAGVSKDELEQKNPFNPILIQDSEKNELPADITRTVSDRDLIKSLTMDLSATGSMQVGGVSLLLFGQKKFKVGDLVLIVFQGSTYELEVMSIERTSYTLRYKNEQINLPIKTTANIPATKS